MRMNYSAPNLIVVCLDSGNETGQMFHRYETAPVLFRSYEELVLMMDRLFDWLGYPQAALRGRSFEGPAQFAGMERTLPDPVVGYEDMIGRSGRSATFAIHVKRRQRATWQGDCYWKEREQQLHFESELELLKIFDRACSMQGDLEES